MIDLVEEWREKLIEAVCYTDDDLLERFLEDRTSLPSRSSWNIHAMR